jgi:hypothetical protein
MASTDVSARIKRVLNRMLGKPSPSHPIAQRQKQQQWSIGIYAGDSPMNLSQPTGLQNPVLTNKHVSGMFAQFVADPFMLRVGDTWYMFFEVMNRQGWKGEIALATSADGLQWSYQKSVLAEPFHLSYPYVFCWEGEYYMLPESHAAGAVRLYKAKEFPFPWEHVATLLTGPYYADSSIVYFAGRWWMFSDASSPLANDTLRLFYADELTGPWREHPRSPIIRGNPHIARPAGRVLVLGDRLVRYAQDCSEKYGTTVRAFEIAEITDSVYRESPLRETPLLGPSGVGWNAGGMHHVDPHQLPDGSWLACVDGWLEVEY